MEYFVIGEREIVLAFQMLGIRGNVAFNRDDALDAFNRVVGKGGESSVPSSERPKVLILTEGVSAMIEDEVLSWQKGAEFPLVVEIPGINGRLEGKKSLSDAIREAVGIQV